MGLTVLFIIIFIIIVIIFLKLPYSAMEKDFQKDIQKYFNKFSGKVGVITEQDILHLPKPVQNHFRICGYLEKPKMTFVKAYIKSAPLKDSNDKPAMVVDYTLCSFAYEPVRLAYIKTSMYGISFEAYDSTQQGKGFMKGVIGKVITLFNQIGTEMDKAQLLTYLGECFIIPSSVLSKFIIWEPIDNTHVRATINYQGISGSGVFTFNENGFVQSFQTTERAKIAADGNVEYPGWSLVYGGFTEKDAIYLPARLQTIWHETQKDLVYFEANNIQFDFDS